MALDCDVCDEPLIQGPIPGPRGPSGGGTAGPAGAAGKNAYTQTASAFVQPAAEATVDVDVDDTSWMVEGQAVFVAAAGYFLVDEILSATSVRLERTTIPGFAETGATVVIDSGVSPAGYAYVDNTQYEELEERIETIETDFPEAPIRTYYQASAPSGTIATGSLWFDTDDNYKLYRWDGSGWQEITFTVELPDFGVGLKPIKLVTSLPGSDMVQGDVVFLTTDNKLYRYTGSAWTAAIAGSDITGTIDGSQLAANSIVAGKIAAGAISSTHVGANLLIANIANIQDALITDAKMVSLNVSKLLAGTITSQEIVIAGAGGKLRSSDFVSGSTGWQLDASQAEFNNVLIRGTLEASSFRSDCALYNAGSPSNKMGASSWQNAQADNGGSGYSSLGGGTDIWLSTFYGWSHAGGAYANRFGKASMQFDCFENGGCTPASGSYVDLAIIYRVNGGTVYQVTPFSARAIAGNGTLNHVGGVEITGLSGGDTVEFGVRVSSDNASSQLNVTNLTVRCFNF